MRTLTILISTMLVTVLTAAVPGFSAEKTLIEDLLLPKKEECLLIAMNCQDNIYVLKQRIERLQREIDKGNAAYTADELRMLREKLHDANKALEFVISEGV